MTVSFIQCTADAGILCSAGAYQALRLGATPGHSAENPRGSTECQLPESCIRCNWPHFLGNLLLIGAQAPQATRVAGFRTWQSLGRQVRKGERGIATLAPCTYRPKTADRAEPAGPAAPAGQEPATTCSGGAASDAGGGQVRGFRVAHVFDIQQTGGDPLPDVAPALLTGQAPAGLWNDLAGQVAGHGYALERGDCGGANGYTDPTRRLVRVRDDLEEAHAVKTLAHELGHLECGHVTDLTTYLTCRGRCEVEAESVAYSLMWTAFVARQPRSDRCAAGRRHDEGTQDQVRRAARGGAARSRRNPGRGGRRVLAVPRCSQLFAEHGDELRLRPAASMAVPRRRMSRVPWNFGGGLLIVRPR